MKRVLQINFLLSVAHQRRLIRDERITPPHKKQQANSKRKRHLLLRANFRLYVFRSFCYWWEKNLATCSVGSYLVVCSMPQCLYLLKVSIIPDQSWFWNKEWMKIGRWDRNSTLVLFLLSWSLVAINWVAVLTFVFGCFFVLVLLNSLTS